MKSDDVIGRVKTYEAIIKGENIPEPGIPESFKVLLKEFQSLALDVRVLKEDNTEIEINETIDYANDDLIPIIEGNDKFDEKAALEVSGFSAVGENDDDLISLSEDDDFEEDFDAELE